MSGIDVTNLLYCGVNTLHIYNRDLACAVSVIIFSATLQINECTVPTTTSTWGDVKGLLQPIPG